MLEKILRSWRRRIILDLLEARLKKGDAEWEAKKARMDPALRALVFGEPHKVITYDPRWSGKEFSAEDCRIIPIWRHLGGGDGYQDVAPSCQITSFKYRNYERF
jgi:hypothetical protein